MPYPPDRERASCGATGPASTGLDRRTLIRRAVVAGAAAWTAPVIVESVASPAGALTLECTFTQWDLVPGSPCSYQKPSNANDCPAVPPAGQTCTNAGTPPTGFCTAQGGIVIECPTTFSLRLTIPAGCSCVFVSGSAKGTGTGGCATGVISNGGAQMDFVWASSSAARVSFYVNC